MNKKGKYVIKKRFFLFFGLLIYVVFCFGQQFFRVISINNEIDGYSKIKIALLEEQKDLQDELKLLEDKSYIEGIARKELGLIKPGETLLIPGQIGDLPKEKKDSRNIH